MSACTIDHSHEDVVKKLESQSEFLPHSLTSKLHEILENKVDQETLNELFHLLKKYDLASDEEKLERNKQLEMMIG